MVGTLIFIFILLAIGELVCGAILKAVKGGDPLYGTLGRAVFSLFMGVLMYDYARIQMTVVDRYTWEGNLTEHEIFVYAINYSGLIFALCGALGIIMCFLDVLKTNKNHTNTSTSSSEVSDEDYIAGLQSIANDYPDEKYEENIEAYDSYDTGYETPQTKLCPYCGAEISKDSLFCTNCGKAYPN